MQTTIISAEQAKAQAKTARVSLEQEKQILDMLQSITKDEGARVALSQGDNITALKKCIQLIATAEGVNVTVKAIKKKNLILVWRNA